MRRSLLIGLSALLLLLQGAALAADGIGGGTYVGEYRNKAGKSGRYQLTLTPGDGRWTGEVLAVLDGKETRSPMTSLVVRGDAIEAAYDFEAQGHKASSRIKGQRAGEVLSGTFETLYKGKVVDTGTWKTSLKK